MAKEDFKAVAHLPFLDYLRGVAILSVFFFHAVGATFGAQDQLAFHGWYRDFHAPRSFLVLLPFTLGWAGVVLFFVISGFCIHLSHERSRDKSLPVFFLRRFFRIYPPFLLACLVFALCRLDFRHHPGASFGILAQHLALLNNFGSGPGGINGSFWSIATEAQLYLLYPVLLVVAARKGWAPVMWFTGAVWLALELYGMIARSIDPGFQFPLGVTRSPFASWYIWAIGAALADSWLKGRPLPFRGPLLFFWPLAALACYFFLPLAEFVSISFALAAAYLISYCLEHPQWIFPRFPAFGLVAGHLRQAGVVSYSAYLIHQPMMKMILLLWRRVFHLPHLHPLLSFAFCLGTWLIIFPTAWLLYRWVELPSMALGKLIIERLRRREFLSGDAPKRSSVA